MWDAPGWSIAHLVYRDQFGNNLGDSWTGAPPFPFFDAAMFQTRIQDKRDAAQFLEATWGYAFSCTGPGQCGYELF